jgi:hypothetical protein
MRQPALLTIFLPSPDRAPLTPCAYAKGCDRLAGLVHAGAHAEQRARLGLRLVCSAQEKSLFYPCAAPPNPRTEPPDAIRIVPEL